MGHEVQRLIKATHLILVTQYYCVTRIKLKLEKSSWLAVQSYNKMAGSLGILPFCCFEAFARGATFLSLCRSPLISF